MVLPVIFAPIQHTLGTKRMYYYLMWMWPLTYISLPLLNVFARMTTLPNGHLSVMGQIGMWVGIAVLVAIPRLATMNLSYVFTHNRICRILTRLGPFYLQTTYSPIEERGS